MGAYAPAPIVTDESKDRIVKEVVIPTLEGMKKLGTPYRGCLYCGLMMTDDGPKLLEYNCRFGDPEAQVILPLIEGDLGEILLSVATGNLDHRSVRVSKATSVCVIMASGGYPDRYEVDKEVSGLDEATDEGDVIVFHSGTKRQGDKLLTAGGRVLGITAIEGTGDLEKAIEKAYRSTEKIKFDGVYFRRDIGHRAINRLKAVDQAQ